MPIPCLPLVLMAQDRLLLSVGARGQDDRMLGHPVLDGLRVVRDGLRCGCGNRGCWEQYASGNALVAFARDQGVSA